MSFFNFFHNSGEHMKIMENTALLQVIKTFLFRYIISCTQTKMIFKYRKFKSQVPVHSEVHVFQTNYCIIWEFWGIWGILDFYDF